MHNNRFPHLVLHEDPMMNRILTLENRYEAICGLSPRHKYKCKICGGEESMISLPDCSVCENGKQIIKSNEKLAEVHRRISDAFSPFLNRKHLINCLFEDMINPNTKEK